MTRKNSFDYDDLIACAKGEMFGPGNPQLPMPPMLMVDRITTITDEGGNYAFRTIQPGPYPWPNGPNDWRPAHIHFSVFGQGFVQRLITQMYFEGDPMIWKCPIVRTIPDRAAIEGLIAALDMESTIPMDSRAYKFDIVLRGRRSTMFENRMEGN